MKEADERIRVLIAEIDNDLKAMKDIEEQIDELYHSLNGDNIVDRDKAALGYYLHNLYNAAESILKKIAGFFENSIEGVGWHTDLLKRMTLEIDEIRPAVISKDSYSLLNELRKFRHLFRHAYDYELRWKKLNDLVEEYKREKGNFLQDMEKIKRLLDQLCES